MNKLFIILLCLILTLYAHGYEYQSFSSLPATSGFRSTSTITPTVSYTSSARLNKNGIATTPNYHPAPSSGLRRGLDLDDDDEPIAAWPSTDPPLLGGNGTGNNAPVGDIPWIGMILLTGLYVIWTKKTQKKAKKHRFSKKIVVKFGQFKKK